MSRHKYVCFDCLHAIKRDPRENPYVVCPSCGNECTYIGVKIPIPPKSKPKEWEALRLQISNEEVERLGSVEITSVARKLTF